MPKVHLIFPLRIKELEMMKRADSGRIYTEPDDWEAYDERVRKDFETLKDALETPGYDWIGKSVCILRGYDEIVRNQLNAVREYILGDERKRKLVEEYFEMSRETSYLYGALEKDSAQVRKKLCIIGFVLKKITPETPLSDAEYLEISKKLMDNKTDKAFKDFQQKLGPVLEGHKQLLKKVEERMKEFEEEDAREGKKRIKERKKEFEEEDCDYHKAKEEQKRKRWSIWRCILSASAMAVGAISVAVAFCAPHIPFVGLMAPVFCTLGFTFCYKWLKDQRVAPKAEKRAEAEKKKKRAEVEKKKKRAEAEKEKKRAEVEKEKKRAEEKKHVDTMYNRTSVTINRLKEAQVVHTRVAGCNSSFVEYIDLCLESKEKLLHFVNHIKKELESIIMNIDDLCTDVEKYCKELHEGRDYVSSMMARYI